MYIVAAGCVSVWFPDSERDQQHVLDHAGRGVRGPDGRPPLPQSRGHGRPEEEGPGRPQEVQQGVEEGRGKGHR